ncbi:hypothetical protein BDV29DRAFT_162052 [Aspergillus leporis]|uniref:Uncharacterized protein n=1 Tax=Aspergillus leporis TaxID=41062 RepID=A0A5N5WKK8_9EURO|nr:hypothetical protein BDV29DRAFT_162052 [Aspergillus leporis]
MYLSKTLSLLIINLAFRGSAAAAGCGDSDGCPLTEYCTTATFTSPSTTTITTCVPTATCLGVYSVCPVVEVPAAALVTAPLPNVAQLIPNGRAAPRI